MKNIKQQLKGTLSEKHALAKAMDAMIKLRIEPWGETWDTQLGNMAKEYGVSLGVLKSSLNKELCKLNVGKKGKSGDGDIYERKEKRFNSRLLKEVKRQMNERVSSKDQIKLSKISREYHSYIKDLMKNTQPENIFWDPKEEEAIDISIEYPGKSPEDIAKKYNLKQVVK